MKKDVNLPYLSYVLIAVVIVLLYAKTLYFELTFLDDDLWLIGQQNYLQNIKNIFEIFTTIDISGVYYRPMITLSFLIDSKLSNTYPYSHRITNILLHVISSCFVFRLLEGLQFRKKVALSFALIFAVHPSLVQAVAWIPGRTNSLLCVFVLLAMISFMKYLKEGGSKNIVIHFISLLSALLTKETALVLPVVCLAYWALIADRTKTVRAMKIILSTWCVAVPIWFILRKMALDGGEVIHAGMINSFFANSPAFILYFGKIFLPINLTVLPVLRDSNLWIGIALAALVMILLFASKTRRNPSVLFGMLWFLVFLAPAFVHSFTFPEYRLYIPIIGVFIVVHEMKVFKALKRFSTGAVVVSVIVMFFLIAYHYTDTYKDRLTFWENAVTHSPSAPMVHAHLAYAYYARGQMDEAQKEFQKTLILDPRASTINYNIGVIHYNRKEYALARQSLLAELKIKPPYKPAEDLLKMLGKVPGDPGSTIK